MKNETKLDVYDIVTERMIALLEQGVCPWNKPWKSGSIPSNFVSKKPYRGINVFLLAFTGFDCPYFVSFKQATELGGTVKKGSKGFPVVFWNWFPKRENGAPVFKNGKPEMIPFLRYYTVFNLEQCEGIKWEKPERKDFNPIETAESYVNGMKNAPTLTHGGSRACYSPALDCVRMPAKEAFTTPEAYYATLFHELTHATGHEKRLARKGIMEIDHFGSEQYSREELVAEMGSAFLCAMSGILPSVEKNSAAYLANWLGVLKGDKKLVVTAAGQAQKAVDYITGKEFGVESEE